MTRRATHVVRQTGEDHPADDCVRLDFDGRHRRRMMLTTEAGAQVLLDLPEATALADGDWLMTDDGGSIRVIAQPEALMAVSAVDSHALVRLAWHVGNRHLPTEIAGTTLYLRHDHVIATMLEQLGATVRLVDRPFNPEGGAYGHGRTHGHSDDGHSHNDHSHDGHGHHHD